MTKSQLIELLSARHSQLAPKDAELAVKTMLDAMANHAVKIRDYMDQYGQETVETLIDRCLSIETLIDPYLPLTDRREVSRIR